VLLPKLFW
jgi:hypothetical protein